MDDTAFLFSGQGSQYVGMGRWLDEIPEAQRVFDLAEERNFPVRDLCFEGPDESLNRTENTQPALFTVSAATLEVLRHRGVSFGAAAGHSLGEYVSLVAAGVLSFEVGLRLVRERGRLMSQAGKGREAGMAAVLGMEADVLEAICGEASIEHEDEIVTIANYNGPGQIVISGDIAAVNRAGDMAKAIGAKRVVPLRVSSAFHTLLMKDAEDDLREAIERETFHPPTVPHYPNVTALAEDDPERLRKLLVRQMTSAVRWEDTIRNMLSDGVKQFVEVGAGKVLAGLVRRIAPGMTAYTTDTREELEEVANVLAGK